MRKIELDNYINDFDCLSGKIQELIRTNKLKEQKSVESEIIGHLLKSEHNLRFVNDNIKLKYYDWSITGCYYAAYHSALALIMTKNYSSKNHLATLLILIKEFYNLGLKKSDIITFNQLLDYQDILFYVESKNKRENATYNSSLIFNKKEVEQIRIKTSLFTSKIRNIINNK